MKKAGNKIHIISMLLFAATISAFSQKQISITIDDPNTNQTPKLSWRERDSIIVSTLELHKIKAALFVCGMRVSNPDGKALLNRWNAENHMICNHSFSHLYYDAKSVSSEVFIADFKKGDSIIRSYTNYTRLFRFPYLKEGNSSEKRDAMRAVLKKEGYHNGYVTIDASDWYIDAQITAALKCDIHADLTPYREYYLRHILERANYYDSLAHLVFSRNIKHTLLIHHSLLNALFLNDLLNEITAHGWELINAEDAYRDEVFQKQPRIIPCGESIVWQCAKQIEVISKSLRYPAEDGDYEKAPLEQYIRQYKRKTTPE